MSPGLQRALSAALGAPVRAAERVSGGDINEARRVTLADGRTVFVKFNEAAPEGMFLAEARGLEWLSEARALRVPHVLCASRGGDGSPAFLALEYLDSARRAPDFDERLGRGLAALHRAGAPGFGFESDNFIGRLPQANGARGTWATFYAEARLAPQLRLASDSGRATARMRRGFERLLVRLPELAPDAEPPARLHGDLWSGNVHVGPEGEPCLIDPAVYGGHREMDLAMMRLFGGFSERTFAAYAEAHPLAPGHAERVTLHQLYPLMVHVNLFGGSYVGAVEQALEACS